MSDKIQSNSNQITYFAKTNFRNQNQKFGIKLDDRRRHLYLVGKTGVGKTEIIKNMVIQDVQNDHGLAWLDPHGDSIEEILACMPSNRVNDVVYFNPADMDYPIAFNILENVEDEYKPLVADGLMGVFTKIWANMWSARMEYILRNCILALLDSPGNTLLGVMRLLSDKEFRKKIIEKIKDPVVKSFWVDEYANYNDRFRIEAIAPIQNKVGQFLSSAIIRNIVGQPKSTIDPRQVMDQGKILLLNLSKGKIGEDNSNLLGAMMVTKIQLAAMSRADIPENERKDFFLYVDEFQNFATESFADILSEARKYRLNLILAHQYIAQLTTSESTKVRDAVFGNVGTLVTFRVGAKDAEFLLKEFESVFTEEDLVNLNKYDIYLKLMIDGVASRPFSATTLPPMSEGKENPKNRDKIIKVSRERYANSKVEVEDKIMRWLDVGGSFKASAQEEKLSGNNVMYKSGFGKESKKHKNTKTPNIISEGSQEAMQEIKQEQVRNKTIKKQFDPSQPVGQDNKLEAKCDNCDVTTYLSFKPQPHLNVFCKDCLKKFKAGEIDVSKLKFKNKHLASLSASVPKQTFNTLTDKPQSEKSEEQSKNENKSEGAVNNSEKTSLDNLNKIQPQSFKSGGGRAVQPGQTIKL